jgi:signal transduction histidine kinase
MSLPFEPTEPPAQHLTPFQLWSREALQHAREEAIETGRLAALEEVRLIAHAQLKSHLVAAQRSVQQASIACDPVLRADWLASASSHLNRLFHALVELHSGQGLSALPDNLEVAARDVVAGLAKAYPTIRCQFLVSGVTKHYLPAAARHALIMVLYNALQNAYDHAKPSEVSVDLQYAPDAVILLIRDNGIGTMRWAMAGRPGRGVRDMIGLMQGCGGSFFMGESRERETIIRAIVPTTEPRSQHHGESSNPQHRAR